MLNFYKPTNNLSKLNYAFALVFLFIWALIFGFTYAIAVAVIPIVYVYFILTGGFGIVLGYGVKFASKIFPILKRSTLSSLAFISGLLGLYISWCFYLIIVASPNSVTDFVLDDIMLFLSPFTVFQLISEINAEGLWGVFFWMDGLPVRGITLALIWLLEAAIIVIVPLMFVKKLPIEPYSVDLGKWYPRFVIQKDFSSIGAVEKLKSDLSISIPNTIKDLTQGSAHHFTEISIYYMEEVNKQYLSFDNVHIDRSTTKRKEKKILSYVEISNKDALVLFDEFRTKKSLLIRI